jgi:hypothetical protein
MNAEEIIERVGGRRAVKSLTGVTEGNISHWITQNYIASHWIRFFIALRPELDWYELLHGNTQKYTDLLNHEPVLRTRVHRLKQLKKSIDHLQQKANSIEAPEKRA